MARKDNKRTFTAKYSFYRELYSKESPNLIVNLILRP